MPQPIYRRETKAALRDLRKVLRFLRFVSTREKARLIDAPLRRALRSQFQASTIPENNATELVSGIVPLNWFVMVRVALILEHLGEIAPPNSPLVVYAETERKGRETRRSTQPIRFCSAP